MLTAMDVSGGNSARGPCFLAQVLKSLYKSRRKIPNTGTESPEMDSRSRGEVFRNGRAVSLNELCCHH